MNTGQHAQASQNQQESNEAFYGQNNGEESGRGFQREHSPELGAGRERVHHGNDAFNKRQIGRCILIVVEADQSSKTAERQGDQNFDQSKKHGTTRFSASKADWR